MRCADLSEAITGFSLDKVVVFDAETTGISKVNDEVLSIAICDCDGAALFSSLVKPDKHKRWPEAQKINGISPDDVKDAPSIQEIAPEIRKHLLGNKLIVGYNASFDIQFLMNADVFDEWPDAVFDVMREYATVHGKNPARFGSGYAWSKLVDCAGFYGYSFAAHDAFEDAKATAYCYKALLCDEAYLSQRIDKLIKSLQNIKLNQTKRTSANVVELVEQGITSGMEAELCLGQIKSGKNKGKPRYECFIDDKCLGFQSLDGTETLRRLLCIGEGEPLPESIPCTVILSTSSNRVRCGIDITQTNILKEQLLEAARNERMAVMVQPEAGSQPVAFAAAPDSGKSTRPAPAPGSGKSSQPSTAKVAVSASASAESTRPAPASGSIPASAPASEEGTRKQKVSVKGCVFFSAVVFFALFAVYELTSGEFFLGFIGLVIANIFFAITVKTHDKASKDT